jgi:hypothetical protein
MRAKVAELSLLKIFLSLVAKNGMTKKRKN